MRQMAGLARIGHGLGGAGSVCRRVAHLLYFDGNLEETTSSMSSRINNDLVTFHQPPRVCIAMGAEFCDICYYDVSDCPQPTGEPEKIIASLPPLEYDPLPITSAPSSIPTA